MTSKANSNSPDTATFQNAGLRRTHARQAVLDVLSRTGRPLTHQEIQTKLSLEKLDRVTLYRALEALQTANLLHRVQGTDSVWRFCGHASHSKNKCGGNHVHFLCSACDRMSCLPNQALPWVTAPKGAVVLSKQLVVHGLCAGCAAKQSKKG